MLARSTKFVAVIAIIASLVFYGRQLARAWGYSAPGDNVAGSTPLMHGSFRDAARAVRDARRQIDKADDPAAALAAMDRALDALDDARAALWEQKLPKDPKQQAVPTLRNHVEAVVLAGWGARRTEVKKPPEFLDGDCRNALNEFEGARKELTDARERALAFEALGRATRSLMKARRILWRATQKPPPTGR